MESQGSVVKHPRYYFFDPGVLNGLLGSFAASSDRVGALFEHLIVSQLGATASAYDRDLALYTFRTRGGLEVDFVARFHQTLWAIEAKATERVTDRDATSLLAAKAYLPKNVRSVIVIPSGPPRRLGCGVEVMALTDLLSAMAAR
jgi:predicted AAA+ superfamily ATPase